MKNYLSLFAANTVSLWVCAAVIPGIHYTSIPVLLAAGLFLTVLNNLIRPILLLVTLPINVATLGLFTFFLNGLVFFLVSVLVPGFHIASLWSAIFGALLISVVNFFMKMIFMPGLNFKIHFDAGHRPGPQDIGNVIDAEIVEEHKKIEGKNL